MNQINEMAKMAPHDLTARPRRANPWVIILAAGFVVCLGAAVAGIVVLSMVHKERQLEKQAAMARADGQQEKIDQAYADLREAIATGEKLQAQLLEANRQNQQLAKQISDLQAGDNQFKAQADQARSEVESVKAAGAAALRERDDALADLNRKLAAAAQETKDLKAKLLEMDSAAADTRSKVESLTQQAQEAAQSLQQEQAAHRLTRQDFELLRLRWAVMQGDFENAYFASHGNGMSGISAAQAAMRNSHLTDRCVKMQKAMTDQKNRRLLEQLEVVLTRLNMLDAGRVEAQHSFRTMLRESGAMDQISSLLSMPGESADLRSLLTEARVILSGATREK